MAHKIEVMAGAISHVITLTDTPCRVGRAPDNDLSLSTVSLSWYHAVLWSDAGAIWVRDLSSTNGTFLNGQRVDRTAAVSDADVLTFGTEVTLRVLSSQSPPMQRLALEDLDQGLRYPLRPGALHPEDLPALKLPGTLILAGSGALSLTTESGTTALAEGDQLTTLDGRTLKIVAVQAMHVPTDLSPNEDFPYRLTVTLSGPRGYEADFVNRQTRKTYRMVTENRVVLLYLLTRKLVQDIDAGIPPEDRGWCPDGELASGIWGKNADTSGRLPVLVHRVRRELERAGFDHHILEKGRRVLRLRLLDVSVD